MDADFSALGFKRTLICVFSLFFIAAATSPGDIGDSADFRLLCEL